MYRPLLEMRDRPTVLNTWRGFAWPLERCQEVFKAGHTVEKDGSSFSTQDWFELIWNVICSQSVPAFKYLLEWFSFVLHKPDKQTQTCPFLVGPEGCGKTTLFRAFGKVLGPHAVQVTGTEAVLGKFTGLLMSKSFVQMDEVNYVSQADTEILQGLVTELSKRIETKYIDAATVDLPTNIAITSNNSSSSILSLNPNARRFALLECTRFSAKLTPSYWDLVYKWVDLDGMAKGSMCFCGFLSLMPRPPRDVTRIPETELLARQKLDKMCNVHLFLYECFRAERVRTDYTARCWSRAQGADPPRYNPDYLDEAVLKWDPDGLQVVEGILFQSYRDWCHQIQRKSLPVTQFESLVFEILGVVKEPDSTMFRFPPVSACRRLFDAKYCTPGDIYANFGPKDWQSLTPERMLEILGLRVTLRGLEPV